MQVVLSRCRFLNICPANNEKQGTFSKTVKANDLPSYLIEFRHDIAHGSRLPSLPLLKLAISECFDWCRCKYWEPQSKIIKDYIIEEHDESEMLTSLLNIYIPFNVACHQNIRSQDNKNDIKKLKEYILKKFKKSFDSSSKILNFLEELILEALKNDKEKNRGKSVAEILVTDNALLNVPFESNGNKKIVSKKSIQTWENFLVMLHEHKYLHHVLEKLYEICGSVTFSNLIRITAAQWTLNIISSLEILKSKKESEITDTRYINFADDNFLYVSELKEFEKNVLRIPNEYTLHFLECLLKYNENNEKYIKSTLNTVKQITFCDNINVILNGDNEIHTIEKLNLEFLEQNMEVDDNLLSNGNDDEFMENESQIIWKRVTDTSIFKNCPLGILPHQDSFQNPLLDCY